MKLESRGDWTTSVESPLLILAIESPPSHLQMEAFFRSALQVYDLT